MLRTVSWRFNESQALTLSGLEPDWCPCAATALPGQTSQQQQAFPSFSESALQPVGEEAVPIEEEIPLVSRGEAQQAVRGEGDGEQALQDRKTSGSPLWCVIAAAS